MNQQKNLPFHRELAVVDSVKLKPIGWTLGSIAVSTPWEEAVRLDEKYIHAIAPPIYYFCNFQSWGFCHCCPLPVSCGCRRSSPRSWNRFPERLSKDQETTADQHWKVVELGFRSKGVAKVTPGCVLELHSVGGCKKNGKEQWNLIPAHLLRCFGFY